MTRQFHAADWADRPGIVRRFADERYRRLAQRIIFFERPDLLGREYLGAAANEMRKRLLTPAETEARWRSIPAAQGEVRKLIAQGIEREALTRQLRYSAYLHDRLKALE